MAFRSMRTALLLVALLGALAAGFCLSASVPAAPAAVRGELDLTKWDFARMGSAELNGDWSFYRGQLLGPAELAASAPAPTGFLTMPGSWRGSGYATLRLRAALPPGAERLVLQLPPLFSAYRLWANGRLVAQAGTVGTSAATERPQYRPQMAILESGTASLDLVLQISSFSHDRSGWVSGIILGRYRDQMLAKRTSSVLQASLFGALAFLGLQNLLLFLGQRRQKGDLIGGAFILVSTVTVAAVYDLIFADLPPGFGWEFHWKTTFGGGFLAVILAVQLSRILFPAEAGSRFLSGFALLAGAGALLVLFTPARVYTAAQPFLHLLGALTTLYLFGIGARAVERGRPYAWTWTLTALVVATWMVAEWPRYYGLPRDDAWLEPVPVAAILLGLVAIYVLDHGRLAETSSALLSEHLALTGRLRDKVSELRAARYLLAQQEEELHRKISEFLHSRVQSRLLVAGFHISQAVEWLRADPAGATAEVEVARRQLDEIREQDIRLVSHLLHPTVISVGLVPAVNSLAAEFSPHFRTEVAVSPAVARLDEVTENAIPERVRLAAYRVLAEALGNVQAHAGASHVRIALSRTPAGELALEISDDGCGFDSGTVTLGLGLRTMAARLSECGGALEWESGPGGGTRLRARIPLGEVGNLAPD